MPRSQRFFTFFLVIALTLLAAAPPGAAQQSSTIEFADVEPVEIIDGSSQHVVIHNNTAKATSLDLQVTPNADGVPPVRLDRTKNQLPAGSSLYVSLEAVAVGSGYLVATDQSDTTSVIRRKITVPDRSDPVPAVKNWTPAVEVHPFQETADLGEIPMAAQSTCSALNNKTNEGTVVNGTDVAHLHTSCHFDGDEAVLDLTISGLDASQAGTYKGTLPVGGTDVTIEFSRRAPVGWAIGCLLLGIVIALVVRGFIGRRPIRLARRDIENLASPVPPNPAWNKVVTEQFDVSRTKLDRATREGLWASWQDPLARLFFVPSTKASAKISSTMAEAAAVAEAVADWNTYAPIEWQLLGDPPSSALPVKVRARAVAILGDPPKAMVEPKEDDDPRSPTERIGVPGLAAVLGEIRAINSLTLFVGRLDTIEEAIEVADPGDDDPDYAEMVLRTRAEAKLAIAALRAELARCVDARKLLVNGFAARLEAAAALVDRLPGPQVAYTFDSGQQANIMRRPTGGPAPLWQLWPTEDGKFLGVVGRAFGARSLVFGDAVVLMVTLVVVLAGGLIAFYVGKPWGTAWDMIAAAVTGFAGSAAMTSLLGAVDRLGGTVEGGKA